MNRKKKIEELKLKLEQSQRMLSNTLKNQKEYNKKKEEKIKDLEKYVEEQNDTAKFRNEHYDLVFNELIDIARMLGMTSYTDTEVKPKIQELIEENNDLKKKYREEIHYCGDCNEQVYNKLSHDSSHYIFTLKIYSREPEILRLQSEKIKLSTRLRNIRAAIENRMKVNPIFQKQMFKIIDGDTN